MNHERERPIEWLRQLREQPSRYYLLLASSGSMSAAAYRLACARCRVQPVSTNVPTERELVVAARDISARTGEPHYPATLAADCEAAGFMVVRNERHRI